MFMRNIKSILYQRLRPIVCISLSTTRAYPAITSKRNIMVFITFLTVVCPKTPIFIFARKHLLYFCNLYVSKNILISVFEPFPILFKQGIDTERVIILYYLFSLSIVDFEYDIKSYKAFGHKPEALFSHILYIQLNMCTASL